MVTEKLATEKPGIERGQIYWCGLDPVQGHEPGTHAASGLLWQPILITVRLGSR